MKRYAIVVEQVERTYAAYVPDLPGCVATGETVQEAELLLREAIQLHVAGLREDGFHRTRAIKRGRLSGGIGLAVDAEVGPAERSVAAPAAALNLPFGPPGRHRCPATNSSRRTAG
jgi:predicted RNase H-like HicB family nuclease